MIRFDIFFVLVALKLENFEISFLALARIICGWSACKSHLPRNLTMSGTYFVDNWIFDGPGIFRQPEMIKCNTFQIQNSELLGNERLRHCLASYVVIPILKKVLCFSIAAGGRLKKIHLVDWYGHFLSTALFWGKMKMWYWLWKLKCGVAAAH